MPVQNEGGIPLNWMQTNFQLVLRGQDFMTCQRFLLNDACHSFDVASFWTVTKCKRRKTLSTVFNNTLVVTDHNGYQWQWPQHSHEKEKLSSWKVSVLGDDSPTAGLELQPCRTRIYRSHGFIRSKFKQSNGRAKILVLHQPKMLGFICSRPQLIVLDLTQRHNKF